MRPIDHHTVFARKLCSTLQDMQFKRGFDVLGKIYAMGDGQILSDTLDRYSVKYTVRRQVRLCVFG